MTNIFIPSFKPKRKKRAQNKTSEDVFIIYEITSTATPEKYVGFTASIGKKGYKIATERRFAKHTSSATNGDKRPLYVAMRKYGVDTFKIRIVKVFADPSLPGIHVEEKARAFEREAVKSGEYSFNLLGKRKKKENEYEEINKVLDEVEKVQDEIRENIGELTEQVAELNQKLDEGNEFSNE